jgi:nucleoside-diphosphate-sugar epimerase
LKTIALRPHLIWGPHDNHLVPRIIARAASLRRVGDGNNRVDTIYIDNAARAHVLAMEALEKNPAVSGRVYFISDDDPIRLWKMVDRILAAGGQPPVTRSISARGGISHRCLTGVGLSHLRHFRRAKDDPLRCPGTGDVPLV